MLPRQILREPWMKTRWTIHSRTGVFDRCRDILFCLRQFVSRKDEKCELRADF